ncbi:MAG: sigma-70 family RNA polymerase sigma factor [Candidatus Izimaplasma sp.]|nr:sigma-70 family RNA polymerase sigma factor [Candidatus Izimaplasma bacterium]
MIFRNYNDFEIINLIKQGNEEAFVFMVSKYKFLIAKNIRKFNLTYDYDDCFQECLMLLYKSIIKFNESFNKTFTRFFQLNLKNYLISYKKKNNNYFNFKTEKLPMLYNQTVKEAKEYYYLDSEIIRALEHLSIFEKNVFQAKIIEKRSVKETAKYYQTNEKRIHNALDRIRKKIKMHLIQ